MLITKCKLWVKFFGTLFAVNAASTHVYAIDVISEVSLEGIDYYLLPLEEPTLIENSIYFNYTYTDNDFYQYDPIPIQLDQPNPLFTADREVTFYGTNDWFKGKLVVDLRVDGDAPGEEPYSMRSRVDVDTYFYSVFPLVVKEYAEIPQNSVQSTSFGHNQQVSLSVGASTGPAITAMAASNALRHRLLKGASVLAGNEEAALGETFISNSNDQQTFNETRHDRIPLSGADPVAYGYERWEDIFLGRGRLSINAEIEASISKTGGTASSPPADTYARSSAQLNWEFDTYADLNQDRQVTGEDLDLMFSYYYETFQNPDFYVERADLNDFGAGDGYIDRTDLNDFVFKWVGTLYGDSDLNGKVDQSDFNRVLTNWGLSGGGWASGDTNGNGIVDQFDLNHVLNNWGQSGPLKDALAGSLTVQSLPEPATLALLIGGLAINVRRCRN